MTKVQKRYVSVKQMYVFNYIFYIFIIERTVWGTSFDDSKSPHDAF